MSRSCRCSDPKQLDLIGSREQRTGRRRIVGRLRGGTTADARKRTALRHRSFITPLPVIEKKTRRARRNKEEEEKGVEAQKGGERESGMEAT